MDARSDKTRVLVIDDSVVARRMVARVIDDTEDLRVEATAANGRIGIAKLNIRAFDAVVLDVEMPELDGLETLAEIRRGHPDLPVIMFSSLTRHGAETTLDALSRGANDYVTKPTADAEGGAEAHIASELVPRIRALCAARTARASGEPKARVAGAVNADLPIPSAARLTAASPQPRSTRPPRNVSAIGIGASTGGPEALARLLARIPKDLPVPVFIVQHMPPIFTHLLAERLDGVSRLQVVEARDGMAVRPGHAFVAPGDYHMFVRADGPREVIGLTQGPQENSCRPAVDVLFRSLASMYGSRVIAAVLTGMGKDGLEGSRQLVKAGARVMVQDQSSSVVWGMPGFVARAELAELVAPPEALGDVLARATAGNKSAAEAERATP